MGGTCWKTFEEECIEKSIEKGIEQGQLQVLATLVNKGIITVETAAIQGNMSTEEYCKAVANLS